MKAEMGVESVLQHQLSQQESKALSRLQSLPSISPGDNSTFYEHFILRGIRVDRVQPGLVSCSFKVPPRLTGIAVVALLRHFGCHCCWELASALKEAKAKFDSAGVRLIAVGVGGPSKARMLVEQLPFPMDCLYADPDRKAYNVLDLYYGFGRTFFNPASPAAEYLNRKSLEGNTIAEKLDRLIELTFLHLESYQSSGRLSEVFDVLVRSFQRTILNAYKSKFTQFVVFYACALDPEDCGEKFSMVLTEMFLSNVNPPNTRLV